MQDLDVLGAKGFFFFCTLLRVLKQGIGSSISLALTTVDLEVVTKEFLGLTDLSGAQTLYVHKLVKVVVVGKHKHFILRPF